MENYPECSTDQNEVGLVRLSRISYRLEEGQPDAMGWKVADAEGAVFGTIFDLLADGDSGQIVFVAVTTDESGRRVLIPVEGAYLDLTDETLIIPVSEDDVAHSPEFTDETEDITPFVEYWRHFVVDTFS